MALDRRDGKVSGSVSPARNAARGSISNSAPGLRRQSSPTARSCRVVRVARHLRVRHERHAALAERSWRQDDAQPVRRRQHARAPRRPLVVVWDHQGESFIVALDKRTGDEKLARRARRSIPGRRRSSSSTAARAGHHQRDESGPQLRPRDGQACLVRRRPDDEPDSVARGRPTACVILTSGFRGNNLKAVNSRREGRHHRPPAIVWTLDRDTPYIPSPLSTTASCTSSSPTTGSLGVRREDR